jgi:NAD(P)H-hydrate repair Nnr-like enzyme with NAD(P)H-hydrate epimerase domain
MAALAAETAEAEVLHVGLKPHLMDQAGLQVVQVVRGQVKGGTALLAHHMVVALLRVHQLIPGGGPSPYPGDQMELG